MERPRRVSAMKALEIILQSSDDDSHSDGEDSNNSISDASFEEQVSTSSDDDTETQERDIASSDPHDEAPVDDIHMDMLMDECIDAVVRRFCTDYQGADGTLWQQNPSPDGRRQAVNVMRAAGGLSAYGRRKCGETAKSNFDIFIDNPLLDIIVECTNDKARSEQAEFVTDKQEIVCFIGITILIGVYKGRGEPVRSLWSHSEGRKCISQFMSRTRYELITKFLRFDLSETRQRRRNQTKFAPMGSVFDMWEQKLAQPFIPYEYVTVDETLVPFRGRCSFKQYMPSKPAKYGLKFWCLCDAQTAYCLHMRPYLGTDHGATRATGLGKKVVLDLTEKLDAGRTVVTDNFFTSLELLRELRARNLGLIGTMRKNRREIPKEFTQSRNEIGSTVFGFNEDATVVSYAPKRNKCVVLLSSEHTQPEIDANTGKPHIILTYNAAKGGVDHLDQMCGAYTTRKRTNRWPKCVFQHMIDVSAYNAFILWRATTGKSKVKRRQFLKMLGAELSGGDVDAAGNIIHTKKEPVLAESSNKAESRLRCRQCVSNKTVQRCKSCAKPLCINCATYTCIDC
jgi:hypothetical protein